MTVAEAVTHTKSAYNPNLDLLAETRRAADDLMTVAGRLQKVARGAPKEQQKTNGEEPADADFRRVVKEEADLLVSSAERLKQAADIYSRRQNARRK